MSVSYVKRGEARRTADQPAGYTDDQRRALGALRAAGIRLDSARRDLDAAQATNRDPLRKKVDIPWREFFDAVTGEQRANARVVAAFDVR